MVKAILLVAVVALSACKTTAQMSSAEADSKATDALPDGFYGELSGKTEITKADCTISITKDGADAVLKLTKNGGGNYNIKVPQAELAATYAHDNTRIEIAPRLQDEPEQGNKLRWAEIDFNGEHKITSAFLWEKGTKFYSISSSLNCFIK